jgi:hypothetical protein
MIYGVIFQKIVDLLSVASLGNPESPFSFLVVTSEVYEVYG